MIKAIIAHILNDPYAQDVIRNIVNSLFPNFDERLRAIETYIQNQKGDGK